jgi:hypothetical protein
MANAEVQKVLVSGPASYSILSYKDKHGYNDLIVHNFGDTHVLHTECKDSSKRIQEVMDDTFKYYQEHHPDEKIDVFIETGYYMNTKDSKSTKIYIHDLSWYYSDCYNPHSDPTKLFERDESCDHKYPNVRFHLIDLRRIIAVIAGNKFFNIDTLTSSIFHNNDEESIKIQFFIKSFLMKQIGKIKNVIVKNKIFEMYVDFFKNKLSDDSLIKLMDIYLLSRLFRTYEIYPIKNVIIYSGASHTLNYDRFFKELGYLGEKVGFQTCFSFKEIDKDGLFTQCIAVKLKHNSLQFNREDIEKLYCYSQKIPYKTVSNSTDPFFKRKDHDKVAFFQKYTKSIDTLLEFMKRNGLNVQLQISENSEINDEDISIIVNKDEIILKNFDIAKFKDSKIPALIEIDGILFEMINIITATPVFRAKNSIDTLLEFMKRNGLNVQLQISEKTSIFEQDISLVVTDGKIYGHFDIAKFKDSKTPALIDIDDKLFEMTNINTTPVFRAKKSKKKSKKRSIRLKSLKNIKNRSSKKRSK